MSYFANFEAINDQEFRFDTRIYLRDEDSPSDEDMCIAAIVGKNPGSAKASINNTLSPISLNGDNMLPSVRNRFIDAYKRSKIPIPTNAYVQVWNLFYLCGADPKVAAREIKNIKNSKICKTEYSTPRIVWFAWGLDKFLMHFKKRFVGFSVENPFYYDHHKETVVRRLPSPTSFAKHPQGMPKEPIIEHLSKLLIKTHG